jgi:hypothetical protein
MKITLRLGAAALALAFVTAPSAPARAAGTWNGQDTLHVPIAWCIVQGSPAQANPNVAGDTVTDDLIWRRHERPTDGIYINQAGITFRSAINNAWTVLDFPIIADPDTTLGTQGDMRGEDVNVSGVEFNTLINNCDTAYAGLGRANVGVTAVNAGLFHDGTGTYVGVIGWGGCTESVATGLCVNPFDGRIAVVDNHYLHPSVANRTFPGTSLQFVLTDPFDQLAGHELGHSLSLPHRTSNTALMNPNPVDNDANGQSDNITLNATEVADVRAIALLVPGLELDPPNKIVPGTFVATRQTDKVREVPGLKPHLDLAAVKVTLDTAKNEAWFSQQLFGLIPEKGTDTQYWLLADTDGPATGATAVELRKVGVPVTRFKGADLVVQATVQGRKASGSVWQLRDGQLVRLTDGIRFDLQALVMHPHYASITGKDNRGFPVHHLIAVGIDNRIAGLALRKPFRIQSLIAGPGTKVADKLDATPQERGVEFALERPSFPHCFPQGEAPPGGVVKVELEGLKPGAPVHALLGPRLIYKGETNGEGGGTLELPVPKDATPGLHLLTVGVERTALTADCPLRVTGDQPR